MTDAHQQSLYDLLGSVFEAGREHERNLEVYSARVLIPAGQRLVALVEGMIQEERKACASICSVLASERADFCEASQAKQLRRACDLIRARTSPPQPEVPA